MKTNPKMTYQPINRWGETWRQIEEMPGAAMFNREANGEVVGFVVCEIRRRKRDSSTGAFVTYRAGDTYLPSETDFGRWAWNYLRGQKDDALSKMREIARKTELPLS